MADKRLVIAMFDDAAAAERAAAELMDGGAVVDDAIAILVLDEHGALKQHKVGATSGGKGAAAGLVLGLLGPVGLGVGAAGGALLGKLHHQDLGLDDADRERISASLRGGGAAIGVLARPDELVAVQSTLLDSGGITAAREYNAAALREAADSSGG